MSSERAEEFKEGAGPGRLWAGVLAAPAAALVQLEVNYALVIWACVAGGEWVLHLVAFLALALTAGGGLLSWRNFTRAGAEWEDDGAGVLARSRFMSAVGILISAFIALVVVAQWLAVFFYHPCDR